MTRHYRQPSDYWPILAQSKRDKIYAVLWTNLGHRVVVTKKDGMKAMKAWKRWYLRRGWTIKGNIATHPSTGERHAIAMHTYDSHSKARLA